MSLRDLPHPGDDLSLLGAATRTSRDLQAAYLEIVLDHEVDAVYGYGGLQVICSQAIARCALLEAELVEARRSSNVVRLPRTRKEAPGPSSRPGA